IQFDGIYARQHRWIGDLESVEMQNRKDGTVARGIEEFVGMPTRGKRTGFRFAVSNDAGRNQPRVVEHRAISVGERIAEFAPFMNRARRLWPRMARNAVRPGELAEKPAQPVPVALYIGKSLGVGAFEIGVRHQARPTVTGAGDQDHVQILFADQPVKVSVYKVQSGGRAPMAQQAGFDVMKLERFFEKRVVP